VHRGRRWLSGVDLELSARTALHLVHQKRSPIRHWRR
jgi:hypothetical protein